MKLHITLATLLLATGAALAQVSIPLDQPITVQQPVTVSTPVTVTSVQVASIFFDLKNERITFRSSGNQTGNGTITITGPEYQALKGSFLDPFGAAVAPILRAKLNEAQK